MSKSNWTCDITREPLSSGVLSCEQDAPYNWLWLWVLCPFRWSYTWAKSDFGNGLRNPPRESRAMWVARLYLVTGLLEPCYGTTRWTGFHPPITDDYVDIWDKCRCHCHHNPPAPIWPTQYAVDMGSNLWPLRQWGDATSPIYAEEPVMWLKVGPKRRPQWTSTHQRTIHWMPVYYSVVDEPHLSEYLVSPW